MTPITVADPAPLPSFVFPCTTLPLATLPCAPICTHTPPALPIIRTCTSNSLHKFVAIDPFRTPNKTKRANSKRATKGSNIAPREFTERPHSAPESHGSSTSLQKTPGPPRELQEAPISHQRTTNTPQDSSKRASRRRNILLLNAPINLKKNP
jgi:hypothetical protein